MSLDQYEKKGPTEKQKEFLNKLLNSESLSKTDYSYIINFVNSIVFNNNQYQKRKEGGQ